MHIPHAISNHVGDSDSILLYKGSLRDKPIKELPFWTQPHHHVNSILGPKDLQELDDGTVANPPIGEVAQTTHLSAFSHSGFHHLYCKRFLGGLQLHPDHLLKLPVPIKVLISYLLEEKSNKSAILSSDDFQNDLI